MNTNLHFSEIKNTGVSASAADRYWRATLERDRRADGSFVLAVRSTRIYCRPSCPARRPLRQNVVFYHTPSEAERHGFRACRRCRPDEIAASVALVERATQLLRSAPEARDEALRFAPLAGELGITEATLRRAFRTVTGLTPHQLREALRIRRFKALLRSGSKISDALYETGYGSTSRIYERSNAQLGMTPAAYQRGGAGMQIGYVTAHTPLGKVLVGATERGISAVYLGENEEKLVAELRLEYPRAVLRPAKDQHQRWIREVIERTEGKEPSLELPLDLQATAFERRVWQELQRIPRGETRTYSQVARAVGDPKAVRAVARACARNPVSVVVPCHRVIRQDRKLAGYRWGLARKQQLLAQERTPARAR
jgi:AraC family transcriptional regulator, regulatory protein of adaptative response / methylated-DNA-[protein]-cysteine methyltransferase